MFLFPDRGLRRKARSAENIIYGSCTKKHEEFLSLTSNILDFPHDFDIFASYAERPVPPRRIFGKHCTHLPRDTSLRRAYADWLLTGHTCGFGHGMILFDGEKIVNNAREK